MKIISLYDYTGEAVRPWAEAGYDCYCYDIQSAQIWPFLGLLILLRSELKIRASKMRPQSTRKCALILLIVSAVLI